MASLVNDANGRKRIQFVASDGGRKTIRLGKCTVKQARDILPKIEQLILTASGITGVIDAPTAEWLAGLEDTFYGKLAAVGLVAKRGSARLGDFLQGYMDSRTDVKRGTMNVLRHVAGNLNDFFGQNKQLREITPGDADQWRLYLLAPKPKGVGLNVNTTGRRCGVARQYFKAAMRRQLVSCNVFEDLKTTVAGNPERFYFITHEEAQKIIEACPDAQWRLIFVLSRYGGLRCPSEHLLLKWSDIDWEHGWMLVTSPKTAHHAGHESRLVPLFPELVPYLQAVFEEAEPGTEYVITRYRTKNENLRTQLKRVIVKAGLKPWPKTFQNLRSTRETELCEIYPEHVVSQWIGNSVRVAREHYLQIRDEHFRRAATVRTAPEKAAQNTAHQKSEQGVASECRMLQSENNPDFCGVNQAIAMTCNNKYARQDSNL